MSLHFLHIDIRLWLIWTLHWSVAFEGREVKSLEQWALVLNHLLLPWSIRLWNVLLGLGAYQHLLFGSWRRFTECDQIVNCNTVIMILDTNVKLAWASLVVLFQDCPFLFSRVHWNCSWEDSILNNLHCKVGSFICWVDTCLVLVSILVNRQCSRVEIDCNVKVTLLVLHRCLKIKRLKVLMGNSFVACLCFIHSV